MLHYRVDDSDAALRHCEKLTICAFGHVFVVSASSDRLMIQETTAVDGDKIPHRKYQRIGPYGLGWKE